jgi:inorganic pyrophosphatase
MSKKNGTKPRVANLSPFDEDDDNLLQVIIETPKGSRNKYAFDPEQRIFELKKVLPAGMSFPYDFGFVPSTKAEDGDPMDVLVIMDEPVPTGCLVKCRLVGVIEGTQRDHDQSEWVRNDRLIAVERNDHQYSHLQSVEDVNPQLLEELGEFFANYQRLMGGEFRVIGHKDAKTARKLLDKTVRQ